jgi:RND family efflux transporter MFP subunit
MSNIELHRDVPRPRGRRGSVLLGGAVAVLMAAFAGEMRLRHVAAEDLAAWTADQLIPTVATITPTHVAEEATIALPGKLEALNDARINARANGYVTSWSADIGDHVSAGQLLAVIDTPELEQQLAQARADLHAAQANEDLARKTNARVAALTADGWNSQQRADEKLSDLRAKEELTKAAAAEVERLSTLIGFNRIEAPFAGVVSSRATEIGQLVTAGAAPGRPPLFTVSDTSRMRLYVHVPQAYTAHLALGTKATLALPEFPGRSCTAELTRKSDAIDPQSGTMLAEFQAANPDGALKPGAYVQVSFAVPRSASEAVSIPASAVLLRSDGIRIATVDASHHVHLRTVAIGQDRGETLDIISGVTPEDSVIDSPPDGIAEGDEVRPAAPPASKSAARTNS